MIPPPACPAIGGAHITEATHPMNLTTTLWAVG